MAHEPSELGRFGPTLARWKRRAKQLRAETYALYLAYRDPRTPWLAKVVAALVVGYAFSPIDLIPDPIPVLGYLDDLLIIPLGIALAIKLIPAAVLGECREEAQSLVGQGRPVSWAAAAMIATSWVLLAAVAIVLIVRLVAKG